MALDLATRTLSSARSNRLGERFGDMSGGGESKSWARLLSITNFLLLPLTRGWGNESPSGQARYTSGICVVLVV